MSSVVEKIQKLLALSESDNVHEAAAAAAMAATLMEKHSIDEALLAAASEATETDVEIIKAMVFDSGGSRLASWVGILLTHVATSRRCHPWRNGPRCYAAGTRSNLDEVRFLMGWLVGEVERLLLKEKKADKNRGIHRNRANGKTWANNFKLGAVSEIGKRLKEQVREQRRRLTMDRASRYQLAIEENDQETILALDSNKLSLTIVNTALSRLDDEKKLADIWVEENMNIRKARNFTYRSNHEGYAAGRRAGKRANLDGKVIG